MKVFGMFGVGALPFMAVRAAPAQVTSAGDFLMRVRAIVAAPEVSSSGVSPTFPGERANVNNSLAPAVNCTYFAADYNGSN